MPVPVILLFSSSAPVISTSQGDARIALSDSILGNGASFRRFEESLANRLGLLIQEVSIHSVNVGLVAREAPYPCNS